MREKELLAIKRVLPFLREREKEMDGGSMQADGQTDQLTESYTQMQTDINTRETSAERELSFEVTEHLLVGDGNLFPHLHPLFLGDASRQNGETVFGRA